MLHYCVKFYSGWLEILLDENVKPEPPPIIFYYLVTVLLELLFKDQALIIT